MKMIRATYEMELEKHRKLMKKLIADDMGFNELINRFIYMYLEDDYTLDEEEKKAQKI